jgi:hypothetical protein
MRAVTTPPRSRGRPSARCSERFTCGGKVPNSTSNFVSVDGCKARKQTFRGNAPSSRTSQWVHLDIESRGDSSGSFGINTAFEPSEGPKTGFDVGDLPDSGESPSRFDEQHVESLGVYLAHSPEMAREMPFDDKAAEHNRIDARRAGRRSGLGRCEMRHQVGRYHEVSKSKRWVQHRAEGSGEEQILGRWSNKRAAESLKLVPSESRSRMESTFTVNYQASVDALFSDWSRRGVTILQELTTEILGRTFVALDPDGHRLRVCIAAT